MIKKSLRFFLKTFLFFLGFIFFYFIFAVLFSIISINNSSEKKEEIAVYIKTNGVHTDIVVPVINQEIDWTKVVKLENIKSKETDFQYLSFGWGDKGFYLETPTWADLKTSVALKAVSGYNTTAMHVTYYKTIAENENCKKIQLSKEQYIKLIKYIEKTFKTDESNAFIPIKTTANYGNFDAFYEAKGHYSLLKTCNTWTNTALQSCEQKCCLWTPFDKGIFYHYK